METQGRVALAKFNAIWFVPSVRALLVSLVIWLAVQQLAICKPRELRAPPVGETVNARVMRGGSIEVTLKAYEGRGNPLGYEIVSGPKSGKLEQFQQADENRQAFASVIYVHGNDEQSKDDEFTFKARALIGGGTSSPIKVKVQIVDAPPQLQITPTVDFSAVAGESDLQQVILANEGGGRIEGRIAPKEPFYVEGEGRFSLGRRQMTNIILRFSPQAVESVPPQKISPAPANPDATITLRGEARAPFGVSAEPIQLQSDGARIGALRISNFSASDLVLKINTEPNDFVELRDDARVRSGETVVLPVKSTTEKKGKALDVAIEVSNSFHAQKLRLEAPAMPPRLEVLTTELDFRQTREAILLVRNCGGTEGRFSLELPRGIQNVEGASSFAVAPGFDRRITLRLSESGNEQHDEAVVVKVGKGVKVPVPLVFPSPTPSPTPSELHSASTPDPTPTPMPWRINDDVRLSSSQGKFVVTWISAKEHWTNAFLQIIDAEGPRIYQPKEEQKGLWQTTVELCQTAVRLLTGRAADTGRSVEENFKKRLQVPGEDLAETAAAAPASPVWITSEISPQDAEKAGGLWCIAAQRGEGGTEAVSERFVIDGEILSAAPQEIETLPKPPVNATAALTNETTSLTKSQGMQAIRPALKVFGVSEISARASSKIVVAFIQDPAAEGYRLERLVRPWGLDPSTGYGIYGEFTPIAHPGKTQIKNISEAEHEGLKLCVIEAEIDGLNEAESVWRIVTTAGGEDRWPTSEFYVRTLPPWQFSWQNFLLFIMAAILAMVLWLRQKQRKVEYR